jgi:hypothetical protein
MSSSGGGSSNNPSMAAKKKRGPFHRGQRRSSSGRAPSEPQFSEI